MTSTTRSEPSLESALGLGGSGEQPPFDWYQFAVQPPKPDRFSAFLTRTAQRMPPWAGPAAVTGLIGAAIGYTLLVQPTAGPPTCLMRMLTGFDCPGCGGTRAAWFLLHGNLPAAARHHAPFVFTLPFLLYLYATWALRTGFRLRAPRFTITPRAMMIFMAGWFVFSVLRNLPWAPFAWLYV